MEDDEPAGWMPPNHPLMDRVQKALLKQLATADEKLSLDLREKTAENERIRANREEIGVDLYGFQQALAKLQLNLEKQHQNLSSVVSSREELESQSREMDSKYTSNLKERDQVFAKRTKIQRDVEKLRLMLKQIEEFNQNLASDIMVTRRAAYGTEEGMQKLELEKSKQDERITQLQTQLKTYQTQISLEKVQIENQRTETTQAKKALQEASAELELIEAEKREYMLKWRASLAAMTNRDNALQAARAIIQEHHDLIRTSEVSIKGTRARIQEQRNENEKVQGLISRAENEGGFLDSQYEQLDSTRKTLSDKYNMLRDSLISTDKQLKLALSAQRELKTEIEQLHSKYERQVQVQQKLDDQIMSNIGKQTTIEQTAQHVFKATQKLKNEIREKEAEMGQIENELSRIQVDALNTNAHNQELQQTLTTYTDELKAKEVLIEKYETEIRQRHDKIDKKQLYIARLNKQLEQLKSKQQDEHTGPLEATIYNLGKEIMELVKESTEKQKVWVMRQTELVGVVQKTEEERDSVRELDARGTVLKQKKLRLQSELANTNDELHLLRKQIRQIHMTMRKINELIAKFCEKETQLGNLIYSSEDEFTGKLRDLELTSVNREGQVAKLKAEREELLNQVVEVEKQVMLWEKKIELERETQEALDPQYGQPEIVGMKKEIHRMKLRLGQVKKQQEEMIVEMERAINKRESIQLTNIHVITGKMKDSEKATQAGVRKSLQQLKNVLEDQVKQTRQVEVDISKQEQQSQILLEELQRQQEIYSKAEEAKTSFASAMDDALFTKQMNLETVLVAQKKAKMFEEASNNKLKVNVDKDKLVQELSKQEDTQNKIRNAIMNLMQDNPKYAQWFKRLLELK